MANVPPKPFRLASASVTTGSRISLYLSVNMIWQVLIAPLLTNYLWIKSKTVTSIASVVEALMRITDGCGAL